MHDSALRPGGLDLANDLCHVLCSLALSGGGAVHARFAEATCSFANGTSSFANAASTPSVPPLLSGNEMTMGGYLK